MTIRNRILPLALAGTLAVFAAPATAADYVQASGALSFASEYQGETFVGLFPDFQATLSFDPAAPQDAKLDVTIPLASADTKNGDRDGTLKTAEFFNVAKFATARYTASGFRSAGGDRYVADGTLELRFPPQFPGYYLGVTITVKDGKYTAGAHGVPFAPNGGASYRVLRQELSLQWNTFRPGEKRGRGSGSPFRR